MKKTETEEEDAESASRSSINTQRPLPTASPARTLSELQGRHLVVQLSLIVRF